MKSQTKEPSKALNIALWLVQVLLGLAFIMAGLMKATTPIADLAVEMAWVAAIPDALVRFIGVSEFLGGLGLLLPSITRIKPILTPLAALGLAVVMALASILHMTRAEWGALPINFVFGAMALFVAWGRTQKVKIAPR